MLLVLSYFDKYLGPKTFLSYPDAEIEADLIDKLIRFFDLNIKENFWEILLINKNKRIINLYFELPSEWARGDKEMAMLSVVMKQKYDSKLIYSFIVDASHKILTTPNMFKAFYKDDDFHDNDIEIDANYEILKNILYDCLNNLIERLEARR